MSEKDKHVSLNRIRGSCVLDVVTLPVSLFQTIFPLPETTEKHAIPLICNENTVCISIKCFRFNTS